MHNTDARLKGRSIGGGTVRSRYWRKHYSLYLMSLPGILFLIVMKFTPLYGLTLAFRSRLPQVKIIFISDHNDIEYVKSALQVNAIDYILKPINFRER